MEFLYIVVIIAASIIQDVFAYPGGPPIHSCFSLTPAHKDPKTSRDGKDDILQQIVSPNPYTITVSSDTWNINQDITVVLKPKGADEIFKGFVIKAVRTDFNDEELLGSFTNCVATLAPGSGTSPGVRYYSFYPSISTNKNCVTHADAMPYTNISCTWRAPSTPEGSIIFRATIVKSFNKIYPNVVSKAMPCNNGFGTNAVFMAKINYPSTVGCGSTKTCVMYPPLCDQRGACSHGVMMQEDRSGSYVDIEFFGTSIDWLGLALNPNNEMKGGETFMCTWNKVLNKVTLLTGYNPDKFNMIILRKDITQRGAFFKISTDISDAGCRSVPMQPTVLACKFRRPINSTLTLLAANVPSDYTIREVPVPRSLQSGFYVHLAQGVSHEGTAMIRQHTHKPLMSSVQISTGGALTTIYFRGIDKIIQIHATLMSIFWFLLCGFNIILARHTRPLYKIEVVWGKAAWFVVHVGLHVGGFLIAVGGFVYILVNLGKWEMDPAIHGGFGVAAMSLALINIIMGLFRPDHDSDYRHCFNMLHRWNGMTAFILGGVAMWLGITYQELRPEFHFWEIIVLAIWTFAQLAFMIVFEIFRQRTASVKEVEITMEKKYSAKYNVSTEESVVSTSNSNLTPEEEKIKGKNLVHLTSKSIGLYGFTIFALAAAFWAGIWLH